MTATAELARDRRPRPRRRNLARAMGRSVLLVLVGLLVVPWPAPRARGPARARRPTDRIDHLQ
jgi:hypothetical protein